MIGAQAARRRLRFQFGVGPHVVVVVLVLGLVGAMAIEPTRQLIEQRRRIETMAAELARIERLNAGLERRIKRLRDPDFIEQRARAQIGLVRPGETAVVVMPATGGNRKEVGGAAERHARPEPPPGALESFLDFIGL